MLPRIASILACCSLVSPVALHGQGPDAQDLTQSVFDQHKSADPTNSDRALTGKSRQTDVHIEQVPLPSATRQKPAVDEKTLKQIQELRQQKKDFIKRQGQQEKQKMVRMLGVAELDEVEIKKEANRAWEKTPEAQDLHKLEAKVSVEQERRKLEAKKEIKISDVPLPSRTR
jgi:Ni,Fe-hydrogenase I large subunit